MLPHSSQSHYCQSTFSSFVMGRAGDTVPLCHPKPALMHPHMQQISMHITARQASLPIPPGDGKQGAEAALAAQSHQTSGIPDPSNALHHIEPPSQEAAGTHCLPWPWNAFNCCSSVL